MYKILLIVDARQ